jgi:hypothetical protein
MVVVMAAAAVVAEAKSDAERPAIPWIVVPGSIIGRVISRAVIPGTAVVAVSVIVVVINAAASCTVVIDDACARRGIDTSAKHQQRGRRERNAR